MSAPAAFTIARWTVIDRLDDILAVVHAAFAGLEPSSGVLDETVADLAARQRTGTVLVAQSGKDFVGSLFCAPKGDGLDLTRLAVAPAWRKSGVARALIAAADDEARRSGAKRLTLRVRVTLPGNLAYFKRAGFAVIGEGQDPGRTPYITMARMLEPTSSPA
jgi:predicted N-acetyltransferase YhbS